jgi:DNA-binding CsgD family transcriptional regulator
MEFATERDIDHSRLYALSWQANTHLYQGRWGEAAEAALTVLRSDAAAMIGRTMALAALGRLRARRGDPGIWDVLDEALELAKRSGTLQRIAPVRAARAEAAWLEDDPNRAAGEACAAYPLALAKAHPWFAGELSYWQWRAGVLDAAPAIAAEPYRLQIRHAAAEAEAAWRARNCPYEAARALAETDDEASLKQALQVFDRLQAAPAADRARKRLRELGTRSIPRGPRAVARGNAFGLTARELEIVALLAQGLTNGAIAAKLHRSEKTVDHHVSAVLAKLDVRTREAAAAAAASHGLIPK